MLARNATVIENQRVGLCPANRDRPFAQEFEDVRPFAGATNHKSRHSTLSEYRGHADPESRSSIDHFKVAGL
jgi:hypothetical protein